MCHAATQAGTAGVVLALEIAHGNQPWLDAALAAADGEGARAQLESAPHFNAWRDGRNTEAIASLIDLARTLDLAGLAVRVLAFDVDPDSGARGSARDAGMAERLAEAVAKRPGATFLVLCGGNHSYTRRGMPWDATYVPMGAHLIEHLPSLRSLDMASAGGTFWGCFGQAGQTAAEAASTCGGHAIEGTSLGPAPFVEMFDEIDEHGHHGRWYVGPVRASPPAVR